jgi:hypothetical protein
VIDGLDLRRRVCGKSDAFWVRARSGMRKRLAGVFGWLRLKLNDATQGRVIAQRKSAGKISKAGGPGFVVYPWFERERNPTPHRADPPVAEGKRRVWGQPGSSRQ